MNVGEPVVGWVDQKSLRRSAKVATAGAIFQTAIMLCLSALSFGLSVPLMGWAALGLAAFVASIYGPLASLQWRALKEDWGVLHARLDGADVILGNPFNLAFRKKKSFAGGDTVTLSVVDRIWRRRPRSDWTISGSKTSAVFPVPGASTDARWHELVAGLQRLGFTVVTEPEQ